MHSLQARCGPSCGNSIHHAPILDHCDSRVLAGVSTTISTQPTTLALRKCATCLCARLFHERCSIVAHVWPPLPVITGQRCRERIRNFTTKLFIPNHFWVRNPIKSSLLTLFVLPTSHRFLCFIHSYNILRLLETAKSIVQHYTRFAKMPEQTQNHLDDTDKMLLGEMEVKFLTPERVDPKTNDHNGYHDHDTHEHTQEHEYNPLTATHGTLVKTDRKGNLVQDEKVSQTTPQSRELLSLLLPLI